MSISLGNRRGELELRGVANVATKEVKFQVLANGLPICETPPCEDGRFYEDAREFLMCVFELNSPEKRTDVQ